MNSPDAWNVLIVGCGNIAGGFDADRPRDALPLTHAGAFVRHGGFRLVACVEPDTERRRAFMTRWLVPQGHTSLDGLALQAGGFDVISICSPTKFHGDHIEAALRLRPRLIFCEKPVTTELAETRKWVDHCESAGVLLAVNHTRRWAPDIVRLRDELRAGNWGMLRSVVGHYNKGLLNNGGHLVDLLHFLLGPLELLSTAAPVHDFWPDDPTIPALLRTAAGVPVHLSAAHAADYALFELQLVTSTAVLAMEDGGMNWRVRRAADSPHFSSYKALDDGERRAGEYAAAMLGAVANLHDALVDGTSLASSGRSALEAQRLCARIKTVAAANAPQPSPALVR